MVRPSSNTIEFTVIIGISSPKGPQLSGSGYFWVAVTFRQLKYVSNSFQETH